MSPSNDIAAFHTYLSSARRILALCGAGLSASSGLPTFRGVGGMWRSYDAMSLATPEAFGRDPGLVWQFYSMRRHMALQAKPNNAHYALAEMSKKHPAFLTLTQNVDGLSARAKHPDESVRYLHGSLFKVKCTGCDYVGDDFSDPIVPALAVPLAEKSIGQKAPGPTTGEGGVEVDNAMAERVLEYDEKGEFPHLQISDLPSCPKCRKNILRPGVVWFGEFLDDDMLAGVNNWLIEEQVDLCIVIGTSGTVYPAAGYAQKVKSLGGKVAVVDINVGSGGWGENAFDWAFEGDAAKIVPEILKPIVGEIQVQV